MNTSGLNYFHPILHMVLKDYVPVHTVEDYMLSQGGDFDKAMPPPQTNSPDICFQRTFRYTFEGKERHLLFRAVGRGMAEERYVAIGDIAEKDPEGRILKIDTVERWETTKINEIQKVWKRLEMGRPLIFI